MNLDNRSIAGVIFTSSSLVESGSVPALLKLKGVSIIDSVSQVILNCGCNSLWAVYDKKFDNLGLEIERLNIRGIIRESSKRGDISILRQIIPELPKTNTGMLLTSCEYPFISIEVYQLLCHVFLENPDRIIVPIYTGKRGAPVILPRTIYDSISKSTGGLYFEDLLHSNAGIVLEQLVDDSGILRKVESESDLR